MSTNSSALGRTPAFLMLLPLIAVLCFAVFWPVANLLGRSFFAPDFTLQYYETIVSEPLYWRVFIRTFWISALCCILCLLIGFPIAYAMARTSAWRALLIAACVLGPLWTSILVRSYAWIFLLQRNGVVNDLLIDMGLIETRLRMLYTEGAVLVAMTHVLLPFMILPIFSTIRAIPTDLERSARNLGAGRFRAFLTITLPLSLPGVSAGVLFVFILAIGFYITPALVGGPRTLMIGTLIAQQITELLNWPLAGAISLLLLAVSIATALIFQRALSVGRIVGND
ncbi:ABC transporter permease [Oceanibacterium hippocampi]|uniref:Putrescine transport system permease protein PotH n=1 Tax=Oceanibacterium hippocampi TaxID=745714 RepID=A0A1Y5TK11_9PROT|nr:ABC transporter permease [Oceanibacterium hippocampi]SLN65747.1 Putrescine transport system permease protein PotH [Oceanibacterium hippocampi]